MKIVKYALVACLVTVGFTSVAQEDGKKEKCKEKKAHVMDALELTDDQRAEIDALREEMKDRRATLKGDESIDVAERKEGMKALKAEKKAAMEEILTEDQLAKLAEMKAAKKAERKANKKDMTPEDVAAKQTAKMKEVIDDLTPEQEEQLLALNMKVAKKIDVIKKDDSMTDEKKKEFIKGNKEDKRRMLESILTEAQLAKWESHVKQTKKMKFSKTRPAAGTSNE